MLIASSGASMHTEVRVGFLEKALSLMEVTELGIFRETSLLSSNAPTPIEVTEFDISTEDILLLAKAYLPMDVMEEGITTAVRSLP